MKTRVYFCIHSQISHLFYESWKFTKIFNSIANVLFYMNKYNMVLWIARKLWYFNHSEIQILIKKMQTLTTAGIATLSRRCISYCCFVFAYLFVLISNQCHLWSLGVVWKILYMDVPSRLQNFDLLYLILSQPSRNQFCAKNI